jgi:hypothetical protein
MSGARWGNGEDILPRPSCKRIRPTRDGRTVADGDSRRAAIRTARLDAVGQRGLNGILTRDLGARAMEELPGGPGRFGARPDC